MTFERYAIYWAPKRDSALAEFGDEWFGRDEASARNIHGLDRALVEGATQGPSRYGLHGTIKAPFRLRPEHAPDDLGGELSAFCARRRRIICGKLRLHRFTRYLALIPEIPRADLEWLASECVTHFDRFRAPLTAEERERRSGDLPARESLLLEQFGYPHIFERFFFHITLAGPLDEDELKRVEDAIAPALEPFTREAFEFEELCVFGDPGGDAPFNILNRVALMR
ncbi:MAG: DUF1045 domain-containing protein [Rhodomicrobiaceae bacterium]